MITDEVFVTEPMQEIVATCVRCGDGTLINAVVSDLIKWKNGELIQNVMPYLNEDERELLISGTCGKCFDKIFSDWD